MRRALTAVCALLLAGHAAAQEPAAPGTGAVLRAARAGRPYYFRLHGVEMRHVTPQATGKVLDALALA